MTYASVATGFKGGGVNPRPFTPEQAVPFDSEHLTAYEIGAKSTLFGSLLTPTCRCSRTITMTSLLRWLRT